jgi:hypothetical protein
MVLVRVGFRYASVITRVFKEGGADSDEASLVAM